MSTITLTDDGGASATVVSNFFIDNYMKDANDAQLKIYLYLLRMFQAHTGVSISDIADRFNHTEKDVMRALRYWEKCQVLSLEFGSDRDLCRIRFNVLGPVPASGSRPVSASSAGSADAIPASVSAASVQSAGSAVSAPSGVSLPAASVQAAGSDAAALPAGSAAAIPLTAPVPSVAVISHQTVPPAGSWEKPAYTLDELKIFGQAESTAQLFFIAEQYLGRTLSPSDMKSILFFVDRLHFSDDLIDYLLQYCVERGKKDFRYIEKVAVGWAQSGISTPEEAQEHAARYDKTVYSIMNALGKPNAPTQSEIAYIRRWTESWGFEMDVILEACRRTVLATDRHRFSYADSILSAWYSAGVHHLSDIPALDASHQKEKAKPARGRGGAVAEYNRFMHNSYDFDALEKELLKR